MVASLSDRPAYTEDQLKRYFERIDLPVSVQDRLLSASSRRDELSSHFEELELLTTLQQHQLAHVPFENLSLHYFTHRTISIDASDLYVKIVERRRGGYCMENNCFFGAVLRGLGFTLYSAGARISHAVSGTGGDGYLGWSHTFNLVTLSDGQKYVVDVGFGAEPTRPLPLVTGKIWPGISRKQMRLAHENIAPNTDPGQRLWIYQSRDPSGATDAEWKNIYCFTELEFLPDDFENMNFFTSQSPKSWFTQQIVVVKLEMDERHELLGMVSLIDGRVKRTRAEESEILQFCQSEGERLAALETWFGIELEEHEKASIKGFKTELKERESSDQGLRD
ncbi:N-terminal acetyltransferase [Pseudocyphellaria aurata]|nr:N-terminal acetyltransferase [Pseudocyphellaria aurata]